MAAPGSASPAQQMFAKGQVNPASGAKTGITATPRAARNNDKVQGIIDDQKKKGVSPAKIKQMMTAAGHDPSKYDI